MYTASTNSVGCVQATQQDASLLQKKHVYLHLYQVARKFKVMKFPLVISLPIFLIAFPTMDSKPAKFRPPNGKLSAGMDFNTVEDQDKFGLSPGTHSAGINFNSVEDRDKFIAPPPPQGKRRAGINFNSVEDQDKFIPPPGKRSAGIDFNTVEDQDKFLPPTGKRNADINFNTMED